jgi:hypothetical protein
MLYNNSGGRESSHRFAGLRQWRNVVRQAATPFFVANTIATYVLMILIGNATRPPWNFRYSMTEGVRVQIARPNELENSIKSIA